MKKLFAMTAAVLMLFSVLLGIPAAYGQAPETGKTLDILFSHDTHSHLNTFTTVVEDEETDIGGFARANTLIKAQRAKDPDTLVIDGGDFSMGTLIQTVFETQAAELRMLGYMGYDVTTFGNHEFDAAFAQQKAALEAMHCPEADWFMAHCLPCYTQNLDELTRQDG